MANTKSAKIKARVDKKRTQVNTVRRKKLRKLVKQFKEFVLKKDKDSAEKIFPELQKRIDISAKNNIIHQNKADRLKSRFSKFLKS